MGPRDVQEMIMNVQERADIQELTLDEIDHVAGGAKINAAVNEVVQRAVGVALVVWDLATNWKDPWA
jgi:hypothetical protein